MQRPSNPQPSASAIVFLLRVLLVAGAFELVMFAVYSVDGPPSRGGAVVLLAGIAALLLPVVILDMWVRRGVSVSIRDAWRRG